MEELSCPISLVLNRPCKCERDSVMNTKRLRCYHSVVVVLIIFRLTFVFNVMAWKRKKTKLINIGRKKQHTRDTVEQLQQPDAYVQSFLWTKPQNYLNMKQMRLQRLIATMKIGVKSNYLGKWQQSNCTELKPNQPKQNDAKC